MNSATSNTVVSAPKSADVATQYLTFHISGEMFALGILSIKEIIEYGNVTAVPMLPGHFRGIINLRGAVVPVLDLAARFGRPGSATTRRTCIVIVEIEAGPERRVVGAMVDSVSAVIEIRSSEIEPAPTFGAHLRTDYILGVGKVGGRLVILLDPDQVLASEDGAAISRATAASEATI